MFYSFFTLFQTVPIPAVTNILDGRAPFNTEAVRSLFYKRFTHLLHLFTAKNLPGS